MASTSYNWRRTAARIALPFVMTAAWVRVQIGARDLHIYGGLALLGLGLWTDFGAYALTVPGALLFGIGVWGISPSKDR